jgi:hypothetical protein
LGAFAFALEPAEEFTRYIGVGNEIEVNIMVDDLDEGMWNIPELLADLLAHGEASKTFLMWSEFSPDATLEYVKSVYERLIAEGITITDDPFEHPPDTGTS